jgi:hypothetical protein
MIALRLGRPQAQRERGEIALHLVGNMTAQQAEGAGKRIASGRRGDRARQDDGRNRKPGAKAIDDDDGPGRRAERRQQVHPEHDPEQD